MSNKVANAATLAMSVVFSLFSGVGEAMPPPEAVEALLEYERACMEENGKTWGVSLCGPMLIVDPTSRVVTSNTVDGEGQLRRVKDRFVGLLPEDVGLANTAVKWNGVKWAMVLLPLPEEERARRALLLHEAWHRVQDDLSLPMQSCDNNHLEHIQARMWMRLEWRALTRALGQDEHRRAALEDALLFRSQRQLLFPGADQQEACLELNEGLAEYTGMRVGYGRGMAEMVIEKLAASESQESLTRSFAYLSGPAYALLLDELVPGWRSRLSIDSDLGQLAAQALPNLSRDLAQVVAKAAPYGYQLVREREEERGRERALRQAGLRGRLVDAPGLVLPLENMEMQFNPHDVVGLEPHGTVYMTLTIRDGWGKLEATDGALIASDFRSVAVPGGPIGADGSIIVGESWSLELEDGWRLSLKDKGPASVEKEQQSTPGR
ncbi:MAG: hypothetical protein GY906_06400 [bacterium]|nr:hypothetical protein [bacterium]